MKIILVEPLIPPNTGSIGRLCAATGTALVLVEPLGFSLEDRYLKRAGLDYWPWIDLSTTDDWRQAVAGPGRAWYLTAHAPRSLYEARFGPDDKIVLGKETTGLDPALLAEVPAEQQLAIPMDNAHVRSLNLAQCAAIALYEARRQLLHGGRQPGG